MIDMSDKKVDSKAFLKNLKEVKRINIVDEVCAQLKDLILSGKIPPGTMLPSENELCEHLEVGRSTVREALRVLATLGLIVRTKRGTFLNDDLKNLRETLPFPEVLNQLRMKDIIEFRTILEGEVAALAATNATDEDIDNLASVIEGMKKAQNDLNEFIKYDSMFHFELAKSTQNEMIEYVLEMIRDSLEKLMLEANMIDAEKRNRSIVEHERILNAIVREDATLARKLMNAHLKDVARVLKKGSEICNCEDAEQTAYD